MICRKGVSKQRQNNNESLNSLIWLFASKHMHSGLKIVEIVTFFAMNIFNEGSYVYLIHWG